MTKKLAAFACIVAALPIATPANAVMATGEAGTRVTVTPDYVAESGALCEGEEQFSYSYLQRVTIDDPKDDEPAAHVWVATDQVYSTGRKQMHYVRSCEHEGEMIHIYEIGPCAC